MTWNPYPRLPIGAIRDLLGITRALYRASQAENAPDASRLQALEEIGRNLRAALGAAHAPPGTISHLEAWMAAERATAALQGLVDKAMLLSPLIAATAGCISRGRQTMG